MFSLSHVFFYSYGPATNFWSHASSMCPRRFYVTLVYHLVHPFFIVAQNSSPLWTCQTFVVKRLSCTVLPSLWSYCVAESTLSFRRFLERSNFHIDEDDLETVPDLLSNLPAPRGNGPFVHERQR